MRRRTPIDPDPVREMEGELQHHLEERIREYVARGMEPDEAERAARARLGDLEVARSECARLIRAELN